jgi:ferredoxin-like protein FixX
MRDHQVCIVSLQMCPAANFALIFDGHLSMAMQWCLTNEHMIDQSFL